MNQRSPKLFHFISRMHACPAACAAALLLHNRSVTSPAAQNDCNVAQLYSQVQQLINPQPRVDHDNSSKQYMPKQPNRAYEGWISSLTRQQFFLSKQYTNDQTDTCDYRWWRQNVHATKNINTSPTYKFTALSASSARLKVYRHCCHGWLSLCCT